MRVASADINGDGFADIITGPGQGSGAEVKIFSGVNGALLDSFTPYEATFNGGINLGVGDVNMDGRSDIITGKATGSSGLVRVFSGQDLAQLSEFVAFGPTFTGGITVAGGNFVGDKSADIVVGAGSGPAGSSVRVFDGANNAIVRHFFAHRTGGVNVAAIDINGDGIDEVVTGAGVGGAPHVRAFDVRTDTIGKLTSVYAFEGSFRGGVVVAGFSVNAVTPTPGGPTATPTRTPIPGGPTATPTRTPIPDGPTATPTRTPIPGGPTATPTNTSTNTPTPAQGTSSKPTIELLTRGVGTPDWVSVATPTFLDIKQPAEINCNCRNNPVLFAAVASLPIKSEKYSVALTGGILPLKRQAEKWERRCPRSIPISALLTGMDLPFEGFIEPNSRTLNEKDFPVLFSGYLFEQRSPQQKQGAAAPEVALLLKNIPVTPSSKCFMQPRIPIPQETVVHAATDGFLTVFARLDNGTGYGDGGSIEVVADQSTAPSTVIGYGYLYSYAYKGSVGNTYLGSSQVSVPIRKGEYYRIKCLVAAGRECADYSAQFTSLEALAPLGARIALGQGTVYGPAATDGFVTAFSRLDNAVGSGTLTLLADGSTNPTTAVGRGYMYNDGYNYLNSAQISVPITKGSYYKLQCSSTAGTVCSRQIAFFTPSGGSAASQTAFGRRSEFAIGGARYFVTDGTWNTVTANGFISVFARLDGTRGGGQLAVYIDGPFSSSGYGPSSPSGYGYLYNDGSYKGSGQITLPVLRGQEFKVHCGGWDGAYCGDILTSFIPIGAGALPAISVVPSPTPAPTPARSASESAYLIDTYFYKHYGVLNQFYLNVGPNARRKLYTCNGGDWAPFIVADIKRCPVGGSIFPFGSPVGYRHGTAAEVGTPGTVTLYGCETTYMDIRLDRYKFRRVTTIDPRVCFQPGWNLVEILGGVWLSPNESDGPAYAVNGGIGGCYRSAAGGGFYTNNAGASCGLCPGKVPGSCGISMSQFSVLPIVNGHGSNRYDGVCGGCP